jgi:hypothetical protein
LRSIATGVNADDKVHANTATDIVNQIRTSTLNKKVLEYTLKNKDQVTIMSGSVLKINNETVDTHFQLLFQRLVTAGTRADQLQDVFNFEMCCYPAALFKAKQVMRSANKPALTIDSNA